MKKSILLLINGFGIERKDSLEIYTSTLMPNLDALSKKYVFGSLSSTVNDYNNGYRIFSIQQESSIELDNIDKAIEDKTISTNPGIMKLQSNIIASKYHIFYTLDNGNKLFQVKELLRLINYNKDKKIFLHIVLNSSSIDDYTQIDKSMSKLAFELGEYCKIGIVVGKNKVNEENTTKTILREYGEHWGEYAKKIEILKRDGLVPCDVDAFYVNGGYQLEKQDEVFFLNYKNIDFSKIRNIFKSNSIELYSLYPMPECINLFERDEQHTECFISRLKKTNSNVLLFTDKEKINDVNYYLNGMQAGISSNMIYATRNIELFKNKDSIVNLFSSNKYNGIIIDFNISNLTNEVEIKEKLKEIDGIIKPLEEASIQMGIPFIISSLFGMHATIMSGTIQKMVNFFGKVPCIIVNPKFSRTDYSIVDKNTYDLSNVFLSYISDTQVGTNMLHKKSILEKLLKK